MKRKKQNIYLIVAILVLVLSQILTLIYRPYVYSNNINDFGFADTIGSLVCVIAFCFLVWGFKDYSDKVKNKQIVIATIVYSIIWEPLGLLGIYGTFDWKDIIATFISGILTFFLKEIIEMKIQHSDKIEILEFKTK